jgi:phospholipase D1/2
MDQLVSDISTWMIPHRHAWYGLPLVMLGFIWLSPLPVLLLIAATGVAFGPVLGPVYALAGCLASASAGFALGRLVGFRRVERMGGARVARIAGLLNRHGTLAVFLVRKVPAHFTLVNIVIGATTVRYMDFILGTLLGMGAIIVGLAGFGYSLAAALQHPSPRSVGAALLFLGVPLTLAWFINRALLRRRACSAE